MEKLLRINSISLHDCDEEVMAVMLKRHGHGPMTKVYIFEDEGTHYKDLLDLTGKSQLARAYKEAILPYVYEFLGLPQDCKAAYVPRKRHKFAHFTIEGHYSKVVDVSYELVQPIAQ